MKRKHFSHEAINKQTNKKDNKPNKDNCITALNIIEIFCFGGVLNNCAIYKRPKY